MLKEIDVSDLQIGMYVHDLGRSWFRHPFATSQFKLASQDQIKKFREAGILCITIDTEKSDPVPTLSEPATCLPCDTEEPIEPEPDTTPVEPTWVPLKEELGRAATIKNDAIHIVVEVMENVRRGHKIQVKALNPIVEEIVGSIFRNPNALIGLMRIRRKDKYTYEHSVSASVLLTAFGQHLGMDKEDLIQVGIGGLLMDIGKIRLPQAILDKPGKLSDQERTLVQQHVEYGREILESTPESPPIALDIVTDHHERLDGTGYPEGKRKDDITFYGMMAAIVDFYDAISTNRGYRNGISPHTALKMLVGRKDTDFLGELVYNFVHCVGVYPIGTLVQLSDGRFGVVMAPEAPSDAHSPLPKVRVIFDMLSRKYLQPRDLDLAHQEGDKPVAIVGAQEPEKWHIRPEIFLDHALA